MTTRIRFNFSEVHSGAVFLEPLFYIGSNLKEFRMIESGKQQNEYLVDKKLTFESSSICSDFFEMISFDSNKEVLINYILDRFYCKKTFIYDEVKFCITTNDNFKQDIIETTHKSYNVYSAYEISFDTQNIDKFEEFIKSSIEYTKKHYYSIKKENDKIKLFITSSYGDYFDCLGSRKKRSIDSIFLPKKDKDSIINDLTTFLDPKTEARYNELGITYKRIYLLEGIPGSGKSSLITALASKFNYNIAIVSFTPKMTDVSLLRALRSLNNENEGNVFFVFEDMDCLFNKNRSNSEEIHSNLTFSGVLNALDGITCENKIVFMTTNHIEELNKALIRPGRVDFIIKFDYATKEQIINIYNVFTMNENKETALEFYNNLCGLNIKVSTSLLQQYLLKYFYKSEDAIKNLDELKQMFESCNIQKAADETGLYN
jgi:chaperone BCS1